MNRDLDLTCCSRLRRIKLDTLTGKIPRSAAERSFISMTSQLESNSSVLKGEKGLTNVAKQGTICCTPKSMPVSYIATKIEKLMAVNHVLENFAENSHFKMCESFELTFCEWLSGLMLPLLTMCYCFCIAFRNYYSPAVPSSIRV